MSSDQALFASLYSAVDPPLRAFLSGFDRAFVFTSEENPVAAEALKTIIPHTVTIRTIPPEGSQMHVAQYRLSQLDPSALFSRDHAVLRVPLEKAIAAQSLLWEEGYSPGMGLLAVHPGSGGRLKCWPLGRYFELIERLQSEGDAFVVLFTGEAEDGGLRDEVRRFASGRKNVLHVAGLELMSAAALLSHCGLYVGNDSGFSHLAGVVGCTAIILFGPTNPMVWRPLGPAVEVVTSNAPGPMTQITVGEVIVKIKSAINKNKPNSTTT
jgi:ADP-heptose:LPS heptosyltransferase